MCDGAGRRAEPAGQVKSEIANPKSQILPAWFGEFGWEVMSWSPWCRARAREKGDPAAEQRSGVVITSFGASRALYEDFATKFRDHGGRDRSLVYPKDMAMYRSDLPGFEHRRFGDPDEGEPFDVLVHARGIGRKASINYRRWQEVFQSFSAKLKIGVIGTPADALPLPRSAAPTLPRFRDLRGLPLCDLMNTIAASDVVVGCSSGTMHLAAACGCNLVVWGDTKTRYGQTLERRYKETWNPQHVEVKWLDADDWQPDPARIAEAVQRRVR